MKASDLNKEIERCNIKERMLNELRWAMSTAEEALDKQMEVPKEEANLELIETLNLRIEMITEMAKHISKF